MASDPVHPSPRPRKIMGSLEARAYLWVAEEGVWNSSFGELEGCRRGVARDKFARGAGGGEEGGEEPSEDGAGAKFCCRIALSPLTSVLLGNDSESGLSSSVEDRSLGRIVGVLASGESGSSSLAVTDW